MQAANDSVQDSRLIAFRVPGFEAGAIAKGAPGAGDAFGQARVRYNGDEGLFDDVAGHGWLLLARNGDAEAALSREDSAFWRSLGGKTLRLGTAPGDVDDIDGYYTSLLDAYGCDVLLKRPDYYIFGAAQTVDSAGALVAEVRRQL
jgi:flavoprotein hydroxylase